MIAARKTAARKMAARKMAGTTVNSFGPALARLAAMTFILGAGVTISSCGSLTKSLGGGKTAPDEFRVVKKAPLILPPDYNLRPPKPGDPRPQELSARQLAQRAVLGSTQISDLSPGEQSLVARAGVSVPNIRELIDFDSGGIVRKSDAVTDAALGQPAAEDPNATPEALAAKAAREKSLIEGATGGKTVIISRKGERKKSKLPGL